MILDNLSIMQNLATIFILTLIDQTVTYYFFFLMDKRDCFDYRQEKGLIGHYLFKYFNRTPINFIIGNIINIVFIYLFFFWQPLELRVFYTYAFIGCFVVVIWLNMVYVLETKKNWENTEYWFYKRAINRVKL